MRLGYALIGLCVDCSLSQLIPTEYEGKVLLIHDFNLFVLFSIIHQMTHLHELFKISKIYGVLSIP